MKQRSQVKAGFLVDTSFCPWVDNLPPKSHSSHPFFLLLPPPLPKLKCLWWLNLVTQCFTAIVFNTYQSLSEWNSCIIDPWEIDIKGVWPRHSLWSKSLWYIFGVHGLGLGWEWEAYAGFILPGKPGKSWEPFIMGSRFMCSCSLLSGHTELAPSLTGNPPCWGPRVTVRERRNYW
jgi:hypothetical protein